MADCITVRRTYKYRLYRCDKKDRKLLRKIWVASTVWNHFVALQRRHYRLTGQYIPLRHMKDHVLKRRKTQRFAHWRDLHSQACQDVCRRLDDAYQRFFKGLAKGRPRFKKAKKYASFTFPQSGYQVEGNTVTIDGTTYKFVKHRDIGGQIKTLTVKRDNVGWLWLIFSVVETITPGEASTGKSGGFDFGLQTFLTDDEGRAHSSPQCFAQGLRKTRRLNRQLSRKVSDLGFARFLEILEWVALKRGKQVVKIDRWYPSTQKCSHCQYTHSTITLRDREWVCPACGRRHIRDHNAAINVKTVGTSTGYRSGHKTHTPVRTRVEGRRPRL